MCCLVHDIPTANCSLEGLFAYEQELKSGRALPVGSVEFVRAAMAVAKIPEPDNMSYPEACQRFLGRTIHKTKAGQVIGNWFVKPVITKAFTGFVYDSNRTEPSSSAADRESLQAFLAMPPATPVWISEPVKFMSEWRCYVQNGLILGTVRYDPDGPEDAPEPALDVVLECIAASGITSPFAADFGVLDDGRTVLIEVNDFWALGLYDRAILPMQYLNALHERWTDLHQLSRL